MTDGGFWAEHIDQDREPSSWDDCLKLLLNDGGRRILSRGQRDYEWGLWTTLERALWERAAKDGAAWRINR